MPRDTQQRRLFDFLYARYKSREPFTLAEIRAATHWSESSFRTYWAKQFGQFVSQIGPDQFCVTESFRPYGTWSKFQSHVTQVRRAFADYS